MKKNIMMRLSALLLVAVLLTTCVISGTFAKYTTTGSGSDSAKVAKWGVTVTVAGDTTAITELDGSAEAHVKTNTGEIMAPGTKGKLGNVTISGTPEVAVEVVYTATVDLGDNWEDQNGDYYCPIVVKVNGTAVDTTSVTNADQYEAAIKAAIEAADDNEVLVGEAMPSVVITWEWAIDGDNAKDTALGNAAVNDATCPSIEVALQVTVNQLD